VSLILPQVRPLLGNASRAMKLIDVNLSGSTYTVDAQVEPSQSSNFQLRTHRRVVAVHGAAWKAMSPEMYEIKVSPSETSQQSHNYHAVKIVVDFAPLR
jgi:hypothetical protein